MAEHKLPGGFATRHIGLNDEEVTSMLHLLDAESIEQLMNEAIPEMIRRHEPLAVPKALSESEYLGEVKRIGKQNLLFRSYIGLGYYNTITPSVIQRNLFENPGWYTQYTPYQAEISQGRLESLLNFQTMIMDLTGMDVTNASLLDEATAAVEAMLMLFHSREKHEHHRRYFFVSEHIFPQTAEVLRGRAKAFSIEIVFGDPQSFLLTDNYFGALLQYPDSNGAVNEYSSFIERCHQQKIKVIIAADLLALALLKSPGELGADLAIGSAQRFGVPLGYGGPHAAYLAAKEEFKRVMPGRIIGVSIDAMGSKAYRMALQTREQHIRREKATSNICTAQALLANMAAMYAVYHGPEGILNIAQTIHGHGVNLANQLESLGFKQLNLYFFDTIKIDRGNFQKDIIEKIKTIAEESKINFRYFDDGTIGISLDETVREQEVHEIVKVFARASEFSFSFSQSNTDSSRIPPSLKRTSAYLTHPVFNTHHSETQMMRYLKMLENKDLSLSISMISLGSCTMKLNAASEMYPVSYPEFSSMHPFVPLEQASGYQQIIKELEQFLCSITGFPACSLQPNSGAQGELTGLLVIKAYHNSKSQDHRNVVLIPSSAHGTNPASAVMAGMKVVVVKCDEEGNIKTDDLLIKCEHHKKDLAALMITYPSTHGVFEEGIKEVCEIVHMHGGQVYMDGANMNAQVGWTNPATIGADVNHINLHKTFSIPHGGGGPGMGPICVAQHLAPFLPSHPIVKTGGENGIPAVSAAPWGSASILLISYAYIRMLGPDGCKYATAIAILNANYIKARLEKHFPILFEGKNGRCAHELIVDARDFKKYGIEVEDIAKRLMDYGFHAPTISFPVAGTMMIEPTESEDKEEIDRFCDAMISIRDEIQEVADGAADKNNNVLKNAPHTAKEIAGDTWAHSYSRMKAAYPLPYLQQKKFWTPVARINNTYGDRNLICSCPPVEEYATEEEVQSV